MDSCKSRVNSQGLLRSPVSPPTSPSLPSVSPEGKARVVTLLDQLKSLDLPEDLSVSKEQVDYLKRCFHTACIDGDSLKYAVESLHHLCLNKRSEIAKVAAILNVVSDFEAESVKLRSALLSCLQSDFENRHDMQTKSPEQFLNAVALLGEIFARVRIGTYPISALSVPVLEYLEALLTGDESEIELFSHLLILISETLREDLKGASDGNRPSLTLCSPLQNLLVKVRSTLMSRNLSSQSRLWLLFVMDLTSSGDFRALSSSLELYYKHKDHLGSVASALLKSIQFSDKVFTCDGSPSSSRQTSLKISEGPVTDRIAQINISQKQKFKDSSDIDGNTGWKKESHEKSGYSDKRDDFRSAFKIDSNKGKGGKSYWLHDNRFETEKSSGFKEKTAGGFQKSSGAERKWSPPPNAKGEIESRPRGNEGSWRVAPKNYTVGLPEEGVIRSTGGGDRSWRAGPKNRTVKEERIYAPTNSSSSVPKSDELLSGHVCEESWD